ncbi:MAG: dihydrolipoamide dehydrogenase [Cyclobacteriaceae bacterium]|jgi:dihydrolipoamide dehydrogenase
MNHYDLVVIGGGPAGYAAAMRAVDFGKKVALVEKNKLGGAGIYNGALWSKTWWEIAREAQDLIKHGANYGLETPDFSFKKIQMQVDKAMDGRVDLLKHHLLNIDSSEEEDLFDFYHADAKVIEPHTVSLQNAEGVKTITTDFVILATGSRPRKLDSLPIDEEHVYTSDGLNNLNDFPESIVIMGAGVIGCEFATIFSAFGRTKVHLIDKGDRILPFEDADVVEIIEKNLEERGVLIHRNSKLIDMKVDDGKVVYTLEYTDSTKEVFVVEKALVSIGRVPNYENLFDDTINLEIDSRGIKDDLTKTSVDNIYAVGDITADISLVNVGELEGRYAVERIFGKPDRPLIYENISTIMFLSPEVAGVGMNEQQAIATGTSFKMVILNYELIPRALAMRDTQGFIKMIVTDDDEMKILGMRVVGQHASSAIQAVALLIATSNGIKELAELIHPHPSIIEGIQECCRMLLGKSIMKPAVLRSSMKCQVYRDGKFSNLVFDR